MSFKETLLRAKGMDSTAMSTIISMYTPLLIKEAIVQNMFDEDLYQELQATLLNCIQKIKIL